MARLAGLAASRRRLLDHFEQVVVVLDVWLTLRLWPDNISVSDWFLGLCRERGHGDNKVPTRSH